MTTLLEELSARARALPPQERERLAEELFASLYEESESAVEEAWAIEIERRLEEIANGTVALVPAEDVHAEARKLYR